MKKKWGKPVAILLFVVIMLIDFFIIPILTLTNKKDLHTINLTGAVEILEVEHAINGLIPVSKDYYYIGIEEESNDAYIIKASRKWLENNFDSDSMAKDAGGIRITALAGKVHGHDVSEELQSRAEEIEELNYPLGTEYCLNMEYKAAAILKLIVVGLWVILFITCRVAGKNKSERNSLFLKCWVVGLLIIALVLMIKCLYMGS